MAKQAKLTDDEKRAIVARKLSDTLSGADSELRGERKAALNFYYGRPLGNEIEGRSQVVTKDEMDAIEWMMPSIRRAVMSPDVVQFDPSGPQDIQLAKTESRYCNHVIWKKNDGFQIIYNWIKDGLMQKVGYLHYWWDKSEKTEFQAYTGLSEDQLVMLAENLAQSHKEVKVMAQKQDEQGNFDIKLRLTKEYKGCFRFDVFPPDEVVVDKDCRGGIKSASFVGHLKRKVTRGELLEMGYSREQVGRLTSYTWQEQTEERRARDTVNETQEGDEDNGVDWATQELTMLKCWTYMDSDNDGIAELREMFLAGNEILEDEEVPEIPWESWTPIPIPHRHAGLSIHDKMETETRIHTALWRGLLDNIYFTMNQRIAYDSTTVDVSMLQVNRPGGHVGVRGSPQMAMMPVPVNPMAGQILPVIEKVADTIERRTGVGKMTAGLDADTLAKATKGAYIDAKTASNALLEEISTIFANTGLAGLYKAIHGASRRNMNWQESLQAGKEWVTVDPATWMERESLTVTIGAATKEEVRQNLGLMAQAQQQAGQVPGLIQPANVHSLFTEMQNNLGFEGRPFITDPNSPEFKQFMQQQAAQAQQPDPNAGYIEGEKIKQQTKMMEKQIDAQVKNRQLDQQGAIEVAHLELEYARDLAAPGVGAELETGGPDQAGPASSGAAGRPPAGGVVPGNRQRPN